jgi:hypothetical protein
MALAVNKDGKVYNKKLTMSEESISKIISNSNKEHHRNILRRATKTKIVRRIAS